MAFTSAISAAVMDTVASPVILRRREMSKPVLDGAGRLAYPRRMNCRRRATAPARFDDSRPRASQSSRSAAATNDRVHTAQCIAACAVGAAGGLRNSTVPHNSSVSEMLLKLKDHHRVSNSTANAPGVARPSMRENS